MERIDVHGKLDPDPGQSTRDNSPTREQNGGGMGPGERPSQFTAQTARGKGQGQHRINTEK